MAWGYILLVILGLFFICFGFYGACMYKGERSFKTVASILIPLGLIISLIGVILTVLPDFFKETVW
jgi:H+/Cl- antiporter ClcA